jgi:hypothetical protein
VGVADGRCEIVGKGVGGTEGNGEGTMDKVGEAVNGGKVGILVVFPAPGIATPGAAVGVEDSWAHVMVGM